MLERFSVSIRARSHERAIPRVPPGLWGGSGQREPHDRRQSGWHPGQCARRPEQHHAIQLRRPHTDALGTPQVLTDETGSVVWRATYDPFGKATVFFGSSVEMNVRMPGQYFDSETGLHYNYFRYYDPSTGRYLISDPIGLSGGLNSYLYSKANPLKYKDPTGLGPIAFLACTAVNGAYTAYSFYKTARELNDQNTEGC